MIDIGDLMPERLMEAYRITEERRIKAIVDEINAEYRARMLRLGKWFKRAHPEHFVQKLPKVV